MSLKRYKRTDNLPLNNCIAIERRKLLRLTRRDVPSELLNQCAQSLYIKNNKENTHVKICIK